jgi:hypothetical protein
VRLHNVAHGVLRQTVVRRPMIEAVLRVGQGRDGAGQQEEDRGETEAFVNLAVCLRHAFRWPERPDLMQAESALSRKSLVLLCHAQQ